MTARHSAFGPGRNPARPGAKTYEFEVELETDEDGWHVFYPPWSGIGASTWGYTRKEALNNIREVLSMIVEELLEVRGSQETPEQVVSITISPNVTPPPSFP